MWRNWNPLNPPINDQSSDDYESPPENEPNPGELVSPHRPHQSPSASPRALLRPDPPAVEEVLQEVQQQLRNLPSREQRVANRNAVREAQEAAAAAAAANMAGDEVIEFETENAADGAKASELGRQIKVEFSSSDIRFWFAEMEAEMTMATIKSQWMKKTVLQRNLPTKQKEDVKALLVLTQAQAGQDIYFRIKTELIRIYAPKAKDSYCKALSRTMVGLPSQLGNQLVDDVCKKASKLNGCCCAAAVEALWQIQLPVSVRAHVSNMDFTHATYKAVFEAADKVFLSAKQVSVAAMSVARVDLDETQPAFSSQNQPTSEVAALTKGQNGGKNKKNNRGQGNKNQNSGRGKKHTSVPDNLAEKMCDRHFRHGAGAWFCAAPSTCPWKNKTTEKA